MTKVLSENLTEERESQIARKWASIKDWDIEYAFEVLGRFERGINKYHW